MIVQAIALGLVVSLMFSELLGLTAAGLVIPGYFALYLDQPLRLLGTIAASIITFGTMRFLSNWVLLYGRRYLVITILVGIIYGYLIRNIVSMPQVPETYTIDAIGYIIPGLIAYWMTGHGITHALFTMTTAAAVVRMVLIIIHGGASLEISIW
jgi:poly-gamma-glutamate biosynthesis protein PgsC/CapC